MLHCATCGNGYDTLRLAQLSPAKLYAFDIQQEAVDATRKRLCEAGFAEKLENGTIEVICDSHEHLTDHVKTFIQAAVFNLGYLPGGDHGVFTTPGVSVPAMRTALELLRPGGVMTVCVYYGGPQGMAEKDAVLAFLTGLPPEGYRVSVRDFSGRPGCPPIPVCIEKRAW